MFGRVRDRKMNAGNAAFIFYVQGLARNDEIGSPVRVNDDLNIVPRDLTSPSGFQSLEESFLGGEAGGVRLCGGCSFGFAIVSFAFCEDTFDKTRGSRDGLAYAINFRYVDADRNYH